MRASSLTGGLRVEVGVCPSVLDSCPLEAELGT